MGTTRQDAGFTEGGAERTRTRERTGCVICGHESSMRGFRLPILNNSGRVQMMKLMETQRCRIQFSQALQGQIYMTVSGTVAWRVSCKMLIRLSVLKQRVTHTQAGRQEADQRAIPRV